MLTFALNVRFSIDSQKDYTCFGDNRWGYRGRPRTSTTDDIVKQVRKMILENRFVHETKSNKVCSEIADC